MLNDYEAMRKLKNLEAPKDAAAVAEYRRQLLVTGNAAMPSHISGLGQYFDPHLWSAQVGFHGGQVDADLQTGKPPNNVEALHGRFDAAAIDTAIDKARLPSHAPDQDVAGRRHAVRLGRRQQAGRAESQRLRPLGRGDRIAVKGDMLFWTHSTPPSTR